MRKKYYWLSALICLCVLGINFLPTMAHATVTVGDYEIEYGWINEPVIVDQQNAIVVNVSDTSGADAMPVEDVSALTVTVSYGTQSKTLMLQPLGEDTPTIPGQYTLIFGGKLGDTVVDNVEVEPEEVETADVLQFPNVASNEQSSNVGVMNWLVYLSLLMGGVALVLGVVSFLRSR
jgi:hypothetical protein